MSATSNIKPMPSCDICGKVFKKAYSLTLHKRTHTGERPYKCVQCERAFKYPSSYKAHLFSAHGVRKPNVHHTCEYCKRDFMYSSSYKYHLYSIHGGELQGKMKNDHDKPSQQLDTNTEREKLRFAKSSTTNNRQPAVTTASKLRQPDKSRTPRTSEYGNTTERLTGIKCHVCQRSFVNNASLKRHMRLHERPQSSKSQTNVSDTTDSNKSEHVSHIASTGVNNRGLQTSVSGTENTAYTGRATHGVSDYRESEQLVTYSGRNSRRASDSMTNRVESKQSQSKVNHVTRSRNAARSNVKTGSTSSISDKFAPEESCLSQLLNGKKFCKCPKCGEAYVNRDMLALHTCRSKMSESFRCPKCYKPFKTSIRLRQHVSVMHPKSHKYTCTKCGQSFKTTLDYTNHMKAHDSEKNEKQVYECSVCKRKLSSLNSFINHLRLHKKFYQCKICKKCFNTKEEQTKHSKHSHVRDRPYTCPYCDCNFSTKDCRSKHIKRVHRRSGQIALERTSKRSKHKSAKKAASFPHICTQCNTPFSQEYLLRKHVMKVHWKEDNRLNKMKQLAVNPVKESSEKTFEIQHDNTGRQKAVRKTKEYSRVPLERVDHELKRYECDTCGKYFITQNNLKIHKYEKHLDGFLHAEGERGNSHLNNKYTSTHAIQLQPPFEASDTHVASIVDKRKILNEEIFKEYYVASQVIEPSHVIPDTNKKVYVCKVCSSSYTYKDNLVRHIRSRAYDHGFYLRKIQDSVFHPFSAVTTVPQNELLDHSSERFKQPTKLVQLRPRLECDVCGNVYTRRYNMLLHRQKHTIQEFKDAGAREDVYKSPDGKKIITDLEMNYKRVSSSEYEVSSSTAQGQNGDPKNETSTNGVTIYVDRADEGEFDAFGEKPLYTACPYIDNDADLEHDEIMPNQADITVDNIRIINSTIEEADVQFDDQNTEQSVAVTSTYITEQMEKAERNNGTSLNQTDVSMNITESVSSSNINSNSKAVQQMNEQVNPNEIPTMSENCNGIVDTVIDTVPRSIFDGERVCIDCRLVLFGGQKTMQCRLCDQVFCLQCSGLPTAIYDMLYSKGTECAFGIWWTCKVCKHLVPKFSILLQQLSNFEEVINNRLTDIERRFSVLRPDGKT